MSKPQILIVEDETIVAMDLQRRLEGFGYAVPAVASSGEEAIRKADEHRPNLLLMDIMLKGKTDGITAAEQICERYGIPVIYLTALTDEGMLQRAKISGPFGYIIKPFLDRELYSCIETALYKHDLERKFRQREAWLATVLRSIGDGVIVTDLTGAITLMNPMAEHITRCKQEDALGKDVSAVFKVDNEEGHEYTKTLLRMTGHEAVPLNLDFHDSILLVNGQGCIAVDQTIAPVKDEKGNIAGVVLVFRDVTERRRTRDDLQKTNEELTNRVLELKNKNKEIEEFTYVVSHDLKTPLVSIQGFVSELRRALKDSPGKKEDFCLTRIEANTQRLEALLFDLMEFSKIGRLETQLEIVDLNRMLESILKRLTYQIKKRNIKMNIQSGMPPVLASQSRIDQVFTNLITNAVDYMDEQPSPQIDVGFREQDRDWIFYVKDNGIGIPKGYHEKIFNIFERLPEARHLHPKGTGVGLAVVKKIIELYGGSIWVESQAGAGANFCFTLPKQQARPTIASAGYAV